MVLPTSADAAPRDILGFCARVPASADEKIDARIQWMRAFVCVNSYRSVAEACGGQLHLAASAELRELVRDARLDLLNARIGTDAQAAHVALTRGAERGRDFRRQLKFFGGVNGCCGNCGERKQQSTCLHSSPLSFFR